MIDHKIKIPDVIKKFVSYKAKVGGEWGSLHIVLADGNHSNSSVDFCINYANDSGDVDGKELAVLLRQMSRSQRGRIDRLVCEYDSVPIKRI